MNLNQELKKLDDLLKKNGKNLKQFAERMNNTEVEVGVHYDIYDFTRQFWWSDDKKAELIKFIKAQK